MDEDGQPRAGVNLTGNIREGQLNITEGWFHRLYRASAEQGDAPRRSGHSRQPVRTQDSGSAGRLRAVPDWAVQHHRNDEAALG
jgi:hypothetical protein